MLNKNCLFRPKECLFIQHMCAKVCEIVQFHVCLSLNKLIFQKKKKWKNIHAPSKIQTSTCQISSQVLYHDATKSHLYRLSIEISIYNKILPCRVLVRTGATGAAAPVNFGQRVHAPIDFQTLYIWFSFLWQKIFPSCIVFLTSFKNCTRQLKFLTRSLHFYNP